MTTGTNNPDPPPAAETETVLLDLRPAVRSVILASLPSFIIVLVMLGLIRWYAQALNGWMMPAAIACVTIALLAWFGEVLVWLSRRYKLTSRRIRTSSGVLTRRSLEIPLANLQSASVHRGLLQRLVGIGDIGISSAAGDRVVWLNIAAPDTRLATIRHAADRAGREPIAIAQPLAVTLPPASKNNKLFILGLTGGIGAGKSAVATILADTGAEVIDSDIHGKAALERADVRETLRAWWGSEIFDTEGRIDRRKIASIVFADPVQRERLESLTHPIIKQARAQQLAHARATGKSLAVVDAPLLLEANLATECDAVLFVDAPRDLRLARVWQSRGWDEHELARREAAQWPIERKRSASTVVVTNDSDLDSLRHQVQAVLHRILPRT